MTVAHSEGGRCLRKSAESRQQLVPAPGSSLCLDEFSFSGSPELANQHCWHLASFCEDAGLPSPIEDRSLRLLKTQRDIGDALETRRMETSNDFVGGARLHIDLDGTMLVSKPGSPSEAVSLRMQIAYKNVGVHAGYPGQLECCRPQVQDVTDRKRT